MAVNKKINSYVIIDFETGGLANFSKDKDKRKLPNSKVVPITEIALLAVEGYDLTELFRYDSFVKPYDEDLEYQQGAVEVTGITKAKVEKDGIEIKQLAKDLHQAFKEADVNKAWWARPIVVCHNASFDIPFLQSIQTYVPSFNLSKLVAGDTDTHGNFFPSYIDTMFQSKMLWGSAVMDNNDENFQLVSCCERAGIDLVDGHRAMNDVVATTDLLRHIISRTRAEGGSEKISLNKEAADTYRVDFQL